MDVDWGRDPPAHLRRAHRMEGKGRGALPSGATCRRLRGGLRIEPPGGVRRPGTLLWLHGGGFVAGHPLRSAAPAAWIAAGAGVPAVLPLYPLVPEARWPAPRDAAILWRDRLGADGPVVLGGDSAGGTLALAARAGAAALILGYPGLGAPPGAAARRFGTAASGLAPHMVEAMYRNLGARNLTAALTAGPPVPPTLAVLGDREALAGDIDVLRGMAAAGGGPLAVHTVPGAAHGFLRDAGTDRAATNAARAAGAWLDGVL